jgi:branched-chain amino acid aminotransferase
MKTISVSTTLQEWQCQKFRKMFLRTKSIAKARWSLIKKRKRKHSIYTSIYDCNWSGVPASPSDDYKFMIILSPAKSYYSGEVKYWLQSISVERQWRNWAAKAAGNYAAHPTSLANRIQSYLTDDATIQN